MKKFIISFLVIAFVGVVLLMTYAIKTMTLSELVICASNNESFYIPDSFCEYYLTSYRGNKGDIQELKNGAGLSFIANINDSNKRYRLLDFFISKGLDVNGVSKIDGLTPLHSAILLNDPHLVKYLLSKGADPLKTEHNNGMTAYEYIDFLTTKDTKKLFNRDAVRRILREFHDKNT